MSQNELGDILQEDRDSSGPDHLASASRCDGKVNLLAGVSPQWQVANAPPSAYAFGTKVTSQPEVPASPETISPTQVVPFVFWNVGPRFRLNAVELCSQD